MFFREFDIPLKEIRAIIENPVLDQEKILLMQRKMLVAKKERMERLIASIDSILKGEREMDFAVFDRTEIDGMFQAMFTHMPEELRQTAIREFGSEEAWRAHYIETLSSAKMQKNYAKVVEWYGGKKKRELMLSTARFWRKEPSKSLLDKKYGEGAAAFFADALEAFYQK